MTSGTAALDEGALRTRERAAMAVHAPRARSRTALSVSVPAEAEQIPVVRRTACEFAARHGIERAEDVALAVGEACANVVVHAYADRGPGLLHLTGSAEAGLVALTVADDGAGLAPRLDSPGLGLGLPLIAHVTDRFELTERFPTGTAVTMRFAHARRAADV